MAAAAPAHQDAEKDGLTGLARGGVFEAMLQKTLDDPAARAETCAVMVVGVDRFRHLNELLGYQAGDTVLKEVASRLTAGPQKPQLAARLGGDEFAVLFPGMGNEQAAATAAVRLLQKISEPLTVRKREVFLTVSVGVALLPGDGSSPRQILRSAHDAMSRAKQRGGNTFERANAPIGLRPEQRYQLESALRQALKNEELTLRYQPQVDREGWLRGLEALLSWDPPALGHVETETFIRLAEETGAIVPIGEWVLEKACRQIALWRSAGWPTPRMAVNVSPLQFASPDFVSMVERILKRTGVSGGDIELEVTENTILRDLDESAERMARLRLLGIRIAIDDFGVGYSPLSYMHRLPLDAVKVDRTFIGQITKPSGSLPVVHTITILAHHRGLEVVAEGVETESELELVRAARCDLIQGFLYGAAMSAAEVEHLMRHPEILAAPGRSSSQLHF
jgi:diguanylate cyclase (GGDEF)-like protein